MFCVNWCKRLTKWFGKALQNVLRFITITKRFVEVSRNVLRFIQQTAMYQNASRCVIRLVSRLRPQEKSPWKSITFKGFRVLLRCVRDSNPWPHAWQACILTNWTNAPSFHFIVAISLDCGCKGRCFFWICNSLKEKKYLFFSTSIDYKRFMLSLHRQKK